MGLIAPTIPMLNIVNLRAKGLAIDHLTVCAGELWCLLGGNDSGLAAFVDILAGGEYQAETCIVPDRLGLLSFRQQQSIFEAEIRKDDTDFLNRLDPGTPAREFLTDIDRHRDQIGLFHLEEFV